MANLNREKLDTHSAHLVRRVKRALCLWFFLSFAFVLVFGLVSPTPSEIGFFCVTNSPGCSGHCSIDQAGFELTDICVSLPPECWD